MARSRSTVMPQTLVIEHALRFELPVGAEYLSTHALAFHPSGRWLVTANHGSLVVMDLTDRTVQTIEAHRDSLSAVAFDRSGERLVSVGWDGALCVWSFEARTFVRFEAAADRIHSVAVTGDGKTAFMVGHEAALTAHDLETGRRTLTRPDHRLYCSAVGLSRDESRILSADSAGDLWIWDRDGNGLKKLGAEGAVGEEGQDEIPSWPVSIRALEDRMLLACRTGSALVLDPMTARVERVFRNARTKGVTDAIWLERTDLVLTSAADGSVRAWDRRSNATESDGLLLGFKAHPERVLALAVSPDQRAFATLGAEGTAKLWDVKTLALAARDPAKLALIVGATCEACGARLTHVDRETYQIESEQLACEKCGGMYELSTLAKPAPKAATTRRRRTRP